MPDVSTVPVSTCANVQCPNMVDQGSYLVTVGNGQNIVGGHRGMTLLLCSPCAKALKDWSLQLTAVEEFMTSGAERHEPEAYGESRMSSEEDAMRSAPKVGETWLFRKEFEVGTSFRVGNICPNPHESSIAPEYAELEDGSMLKFNSMHDYLPIQRIK